MSCINQVTTDRYTAIHGDCVEAVADLPDACVGYSIFSPPFASLYTYSNSPRDMGNVRSDAEFFEHLDFLIAQLRRVMMPGRDVSRFTAWTCRPARRRDGYIRPEGVSQGELLRAFQKHGFIFHSKVTIWKDPVTAMQRTKALGLLHKSVRENAAMCRQGIPDYLITVRTPGEQAQRVTHDDYPVDLWQRVASPIWTDINPSDTLQYRSAREHDDERHICPLQLEVIRRGVTLWTNPGDVVLSPFMGIGSEGFVSLELGRRFVGVELKKSYYEQAVRNLEAATKEKAQDLFAEAA